MANESELIKEEFPVTILHSSQQEDGENWITGDVIKRWTDNPLGVSPEYPYEFCCTRYYTYKDKNNAAIPNSLKKGWQPWDIKNISLWAHYGMNATPYQLLLGNPYESIYLIEASGATREAYVIIDGDGISTGEIILLGGYENKDQKFNLKIDEISILDSTGNIEHRFDTNYLTLDLGSNWKCRFELSNNNGNPVIKIIGIGPNPESAVTPPDSIELDPKDSCFKCDLGGKYLLKIIIQAKNNKKNIKTTTTWTVTAIRDKNGDGIWRYLIMPSIDRVVRNIYYKRIGEDDKAVTAVKDAWNVGTANTLKFDLEKDTYGKSWKDINLSEQKCRIRIGRPTGNNEYEVLYNQEATSNPEIIDFDTVKSMFTGFLSDKSLLEPHMAQYTVEMLVEDPDYGEGFSVVDKCNLIFEYIVSESGKNGEDGKDGENGKDGTSSVFNLSNDSGSFAYDYKVNESNYKIILNKNDKTTDIQYSVESNYKCCDGIKIGETIYEEPGPGSYNSTLYGSVSFKLTKNTEYWTLEITDITTSQYESIFTIPITGIVAGKEVGTATFKMVGIKDLDENGIYAYRLACEHPYSTEDSSETDYLDIDVYKDALVEGFGYNTGTKVLVRIFSKKSGNELSSSPKELGTVFCKTPIKGIRTGVSMYTVQLEHGVIVKLYAADKDYENTDNITVAGTTYYFTGEAEDIPWTAPLGPPGNSGEIDYDKLKDSITTISCNNDNIVVIPSNKYTFTFKDIAGKNIKKNITFGELNSNFFEKIVNIGEGIYELTAKTTIQHIPFTGTITYGAEGYQSGEITYTWVGDANSDGVYYDYEIEPSALVLGYTEVNGNLAFNIGKITITCKSVRHEGILKTQTKGSGYILVGSNELGVDNANAGELKDGQVTITLGESEGLHYSGTNSFRVYWFTADEDYATAAAGNMDIPTIQINGTTYYQVDSELIDVVPNTAIDATVNLQAYTGSGTFIVDPKALTATFEYKSDAPGYYLVRFNKALYGGTGDIYFANTTSDNKKEPIKISMGPELMRTTTTSTENLLTLDNIEGPYGLGNYEKPVETSTVAWIKCPSVHVGIYKEKAFKTLLFEDTVVRTGLDGYYWNVDENGVVSIQSNGDVMTSINQTANSIVSIASGVSPNLCKGAATNKTSLFTWVKGESGLAVSSSEYNNSQIIIPPSTDCEAGTGLLVSTSTSSGTTLYTYSAPDFKLNEGYYGISLSPTTPTTGNITVTYDGNLIIENSNTPSGSAILITSAYNGKGIKFTVDEALIGSDYILSFYASLSEGTIYVKANKTKYELAATGSMKRYIIKLDNLQSKDVIIYKNGPESALQISSILFEKGSLVTDWKDYGLDVSSIILEASKIEARVESIEGKQSELELTAGEIKAKVDNLEKGTTASVRVEGDTIVADVTSGDGQSTGLTIDTSGSTFSGKVAANAFLVNTGGVTNITQDDLTKGVMWLTTISAAKEALKNVIGNSIQIVGLSAAASTQANLPIFLIKVGGSAESLEGANFFVLNPLQLTNNEGVQVNFEEVKNSLIHSLDYSSITAKWLYTNTSSNTNNYFHGDNDKIYSHPNIGSEITNQITILGLFREFGIYFLVKSERNGELYVKVPAIEYVLSEVDQDSMQLLRGRYISTIIPLYNEETNKVYYYFYNSKDDNYTFLKTPIKITDSSKTIKIYDLTAVDPNNAIYETGANLEYSIDSNIGFTYFTGYTDTLQEAYLFDEQGYLDLLATSKIYDQL